MSKKSILNNTSGAAASSSNGSRGKSVNNLYQVLNLNSGGKGAFVNENKYSFQHPYTSLAIGKTSSGKTSIAMSNLFLGTPDPNNPNLRVSNVSDCYVFTGQESLDDPIYTELAKRYPDNFKVYPLHSFTEWLAALKAEYKDIEQEGGNKYDLPQTLVCVDDFLGSTDMTKQILNFATYCRKLSCSLLFICQSFIEINKTTRDNARYLILCNSLSKQQLDQIAALVRVQAKISRDDFFDLYQYATDVRHTTTGDPLDAFMVVDLGPSCPPGERFRQGFYKYLTYDEEVYKPRGRPVKTVA